MVNKQHLESIKQQLLEDSFEAVAGLLVHRDRGSQYASKLYQKTLNRHEFVCSMSRKGNCWCII